jgi:hypothetical protein
MIDCAKPAAGKPTAGFRLSTKWKASAVYAPALVSGLVDLVFALALWSAPRGSSGLRPAVHPSMGRVPVAFEPYAFGEGRGDGR